MRNTHRVKKANVSKTVGKLISNDQPHHQGRGEQLEKGIEETENYEAKEYNRVKVEVKGAII